MSSIEDNFMFDDTHRVVVSLGCKGSGKTHTVINYLKVSLLTNKYKEYHLVLPAYKNEKDGQYDFLKQYKNKVFIYNTYNSQICERIKKPNTLLIVDDATSNGLDLKKDQKFLQLITTTRHCQCMVWLVFHSARSVMSVPLRANIDYLFMYKTTNKKLIEVMWEEYFSMYPEFQKQSDFVNYYYDSVLQDEHNAIFIDLVRSEYDNSVNQWELNKNEWKLNKEKISKPKTEIKKSQNFFSHATINDRPNYRR
jgi:hypothetical protein